MAELTGVTVKKSYTVPTFQLYQNGTKIGNDLQDARKKDELEELIKMFSSFSLTLNEKENSERIQSKIAKSNPKTCSLL